MDLDWSLTFNIFTLYLSCLLINPVTLKSSWDASPGFQWKYLIHLKYYNRINLKMLSPELKVTKTGEGVYCQAQVQ